MQLVQHGQGPGPASQLSSYRDVGDHGPFTTCGEHRPPLVESPVPFVTAEPRRRRCLVPAAHQDLPRAVGLAVVPGGLHQQPTGVAVAGLGDRSLGSGLARGVLGRHNPQKAPMVAPVNRCQSPISTASPNPVNVEMPRRQPSRRTTGV